MLRLAIWLRFLDMLPAAIVDVSGYLRIRILHSTPELLAKEDRPNWACSHIWGMACFQLAVADPNYAGSTLLMFWHSNDQTKSCLVTHMGRECFRMLAMPLHLQKCVARFVSDSWVSCFVANSLPGKYWRRIRILHQRQATVESVTVILLASSTTPDNAPFRLPE